MIGLETHLKTDETGRIWLTLPEKGPWPMRLLKALVRAHRAPESVECFTMVDPANESCLRLARRCGFAQLRIVPTGPGMSDPKPMQVLRRKAR